MTLDLPLPLDTTVVSQLYPQVYHKLSESNTWLKIQVAARNGSFNIAYALLFKFFASENEPVVINRYGDFWGWNDLEGTYEYLTEDEAIQVAANRMYSILESRSE